MENQDKDEIHYARSYKIDYGHIDVEDIMAQVRDKAARQAAAGAPAEPEPLEADLPPAGSFIPTGPLTLKKKIKMKVQRFLTPFFPLMRLMALPVHEDLMQTVQKLHQANMRLDDLAHRVAERRDYIKLLHLLCHNLVVEVTKLRVEHDTLKSKVQTLEKDFEYLGKREKALEKRIVP